MASKTTTAGFRIPTVSSSYHEKCIAPSVKAIQGASASAGSNKTFAQVAYKSCNAVAQEKIWSEHVQKEHKTSKSWHKNWQFITEYDYRGNVKPKKKLPEKVSFFDASPNVPHTTSKQLGSRVLTTGSRNMYKLEMTSCYRKRRTDIARLGTQ